MVDLIITWFWIATLDWQHAVGRNTPIWVQKNITVYSKLDFEKYWSRLEWDYNQEIC